MKNKTVSSILYLIYGFLLTVGPHTLFAVCEQGENMMRCGWTARTETAIGIFVIYLTILNFLIRKKESRFWINLSILGTILLAITIPSGVIGGCAMADMQCKVVAFPAIYILSGATLLFAVGNSLYLKGFFSQKGK